MKFTEKTKVAVELWLVGMLGVLALSFFVLPQMLSGQELPLPKEILIAISIVQSAVFLAIASWVGSNLSQKVSLTAPAAQAFAMGRSVKSALGSQVWPGIVGGVLGATVLIIASLFLPQQLANLEGSVELPLVAKVFYGGFTEEILMRWGVMTIIVWGTWALFQKKEGKPNKGIVWFAIIISSLLFAVGHLPAAATFVEASLTNSTIAYILIFNSLFGFVAGFLYWRFGLESAIIAHIVAHLLSHFGV